MREHLSLLFLGKGPGTTTWVLRPSQWVAVAQRKARRCNDRHYEDPTAQCSNISPHTQLALTPPLSISGMSM